MNVPSFRKGVALDTFFYAYTPGWLEMLANPWAILFILVFVLGTTCFVWGVDRGRDGAVEFGVASLLPLVLITIGFSVDYDDLDAPKAVSDHYGVEARSVECPDRVSAGECVAYTDNGSSFVIHVSSGHRTNGGWQVVTKRVNDGPWPISTKGESK